MRCRDTMADFMISSLVLDLRGFKNRYSSHEMFSNSTRFTHESRVPTKPWPMPPSPCCARDLSRAFWLARSQTPRIIRVHRWMLPDRTATLSPFDSTCSTWVSTVCIHRVAHASFSTRFSSKQATVSRHSSHRFPASSPRYAWCRCLFNSYSSSHPKSISFVKKLF